MKTLNLDDQIGTLVQQPIQTLFAVMLEQLQHRCFLENILMQSINRNALAVLKVGFEECCDLVDVEEGGMFLWDDETKCYRSEIIVGDNDSLISNKPDTLEAYMIRISSMNHMSQLTLLPITSSGKTIAMYLLKKRANL